MGYPLRAHDVPLMSTHNGIPNVYTSPAQWAPRVYPCLPLDCIQEGRAQGDPRALTDSLLIKY